MLLNTLASFNLLGPALQLGVLVYQDFVVAMGSPKRGSEFPKANASQSEHQYKNECFFVYVPGLLASLLYCMSSQSVDMQPDSQECKKRMLRNSNKPNATARCHFFIFALWFNNRCIRGSQCNHILQ